MVRSNRGRSAALRHIWSWPVYSPRRFVTTLLITVILIVVGGKLGRTAFEGNAPAAPLPTITLTSTVTATPTASTTP